MLEVAHDHRLGHQPGRASILVFANHARMGVYADALALDPAAPDVTATESPGRVKYGASTNLEQALAPDLGVFARAGWNDGRTQTWAFTEIDRTVALGMSAEGSRWGLPGDRLGAAGIGNGLSRWHRDYLAAGGSGFILGDGRLDYAPERIL
jgi:high affinity Mn2+ porin